MNCEMNLRISTSISVEKRWYELEDGFRKLEQIPPTASRGQTCHRGQSASPDVAGKLEEERNATPLRRWGRMEEDEGNNEFRCPIFFESRSPTRHPQIKGRV
jgi:hypothetical protein